MRLLLTITFAYLYSWGYLTAQDSLLISLDQVRTAVSKHNTSIKITAQQVIAAQANYNQSKAVYLPNITASHTAMLTTNPLMAFGSRLNQARINSSDFDPNSLNNPDAIQNFATILEFQQPIVNLDGIYQRKAAHATLQATSLQQQRTIEQLELEVVTAYMQLQLAYKGVSVVQKSLDAAQHNLAWTQQRFDQGYLQYTDVLNMQIQVHEAQNQLQTAHSNVINASNLLSYLMDSDHSIIYQPSDSLAIQSLTQVAYQLSKNRSDIKALQLINNAMEATNKSDQMALVPRINAFGSVELYDRNLFQASANGYTIGAQLSWDIMQGNKRSGQINKSKAQLQQSQLTYDQYLSHSKLELNKAQRKLTDAINKLELSKLTVQQSSESLRIHTNRFKQGLTSSTDLINAATQHAQKELEYYQTIFDVNQAQAYLKFLTSTN